MRRGAPARPWPVVTPRRFVRRYRMEQGEIQALQRAVEVHFIPGSHVTLASEPNVRVLAERIRDSLAVGHARAAAADEPGEAPR